MNSQKAIVDPISASYNPVRSKMVGDPSHYAWSSHGAYLKCEAKSWISVEEVSLHWGKAPARAIAGYRRFVQEGLADGHPDDLYQVVNQGYLGDEAFVERVKKREPAMRQYCANGNPGPDGFHYSPVDGHLRKALSCRVVNFRLTGFLRCFAACY